MKRFFVLLLVVLATIAVAMPVAAHDDGHGENDDDYVLSQDQGEDAVMFPVFRLDQDSQDSTTLLLPASCLTTMPGLPAHDVWPDSPEHALLHEWFFPVNDDQFGIQHGCHPGETYQWICGWECVRDNPPPNGNGECVEWRPRWCYHRPHPCN